MPFCRRPKRRSFFPTGRPKPKRASWSYYPPCERIWRRGWAERLLRKFFIDWFGGIGGGKWRRIPGIPRAILLSRRSGKKNASGTAGGRVETGASAGADRALVFSGRSPLWADGPIPPLLGSQPAPSKGLQWLRARVHLCVRGGQSTGRETGLEPEFQDEYPPDAGFSQPSQHRAPGGIHSHDCGWRQLAQEQGLGDTRKHALDPFAPILPGTEPAGAYLG